MSRGTTVGNMIVGDDLRAELRLARVGNKRAAIKCAEPRPGQCPNCGGLGRLVLGLEPPEVEPDHKTISRWYWEQQPEKPAGFYPTQVSVWECVVCSSGAHDRRDLLWLTSGLSDTEQNLSLDFFEGFPGKEVALSVSRELLSKSPRPTGLTLFYGAFGVGKTGLLKSLVAAFLRVGVSARYVTAGDILREVRATFKGDQAQSEREVLENYLRFAFLAVDEVHLTSETAWANECLFALLDKRYSLRASLATALATSLSPTALGPQLAYLASRLMDGARVPVGGESLRGQRSLV